MMWIDLSDGLAVLINEGYFKVVFCGIRVQLFDMYGLNFILDPFLPGHIEVAVVGLFLGSERRDEIH